MKLMLVLIVFCAVIANTQSEVLETTQSENGYSGRPYGPYNPYMQGYRRIKRVKYSNPPLRIYSRPPSTFPTSGAYSYTPPPGYMTDNDEPSYPGSLYHGIPRPKVSNRPNQGLNEEDLQNFAKYLSKQDLGKILEYAGHNRDEKSRDPHEKPIDRPTTDDYINIGNSINDPKLYSPRPTEIFKALVKEIDLDPKFDSYQEKKPSDEYQNNRANYETDRVLPYAKFNDYQETSNNEFSNNIATSSYTTNQAQLPPFYSNSPDHIYNEPSDTQESMTQTNSNTPNDVLTESEVPELPRPLNLRDELDSDVSFTHNVPTVVKADPSYKLENFGELPLMNYNSKLDTLSSYHVPHYTVTSGSSTSSNAEPSSSYAAPSPSYTSSSSIPAVEPAPPPSAAKEQSDAHLKAVRIWSHRSTGTAYTLHNDGTLSLEKPGRAKGGYGY